MADELAEVLKKFDLSRKEKEEVDLCLGDTDLGREACQKSLFGRVIGEKITNITGIKNFANHMWGYPKEMSVVEIGFNLYQFSFVEEHDIRRVLAGRPYVIDNQLLNIKEWEENIDKNPNALRTSLMWVQFWNIPVHWLTKEVGKKIGSTIGPVEKVIVLIGGSKHGRHMKIRTEVDISQPLQRGSMVRMRDSSRWIEFRYERCPDFCYVCGIIGHNDRACSYRVEPKNDLIKPQLGGWLKALGNKSSLKKSNPRNTDLSSSTMDANQTNRNYRKSEPDNTRLTGDIAMLKLNERSGGDSASGKDDGTSRCDVKGRKVYFSGQISNKPKGVGTGKQGIENVEMGNKAQGVTSGPGFLDIDKVNKSLEEQLTTGPNEQSEMNIVVELNTGPTMHQAALDMQTCPLDNRSQIVAKKNGIRKFKRKGNCKTENGAEECKVADRNIRIPLHPLEPNAIQKGEAIKRKLIQELEDEGGMQGDEQKSKKNRTESRMEEAKGTEGRETNLIWSPMIQ